MEALVYKKREENIAMPIFGIIAITLTLFLFYVDEGYNSFQWMADIKNWFCFICYSAGFFLGQTILFIAFQRLSNVLKYPLSIIGGLLVGFFISVILMGSLGILFQIF